MTQPDGVSDGGAPTGTPTLPDPAPVALQRGAGDAEAVHRDAAAAGHRLLTLLVLAVAAVVATLAGLVADRLGARGEVTGGAACLAVLVVAGFGYWRLQGDVLHVAVGLAVPGAALGAARVGGWYEETPTGWIIVAVGVAWAALTVAGWLAERGLGFGWAAVLLFVGGQVLTAGRSPSSGFAVLALLGVAALIGFGVLARSGRGRSLTLLAVGVATLAVMIPQLVAAL
jgi:hypothetical protein